MTEAAAGDVRRRALTTAADLAARIELVRSASERAGRPRDAVAVSTQIWFTAYGSAEDVHAAESALAADWAALPGHPLRDSPCFRCWARETRASRQRVLPEIPLTCISRVEGTGQSVALCQNSPSCARSYSARLTQGCEVVPSLSRTTSRQHSASEHDPHTGTATGPVRVPPA